MCGIAGIFDCRGRGEADRRLLRRMTDVLAHRGPDGDGFYHAPGVGLGHRRLAIIDLAGGEQPLFNEDRTVCVVFNGEIYNFQAADGRAVVARPCLSHAAATPRSSSTPGRNGASAASTASTGMFAFALCGRAARDAVAGARPVRRKAALLRFLDDGRLLFASELKSMLCSPAVDRRLDPQAVEEFFAFGYIPDPRSIYSGCAKSSRRRIVCSSAAASGRGSRDAYWQLRFVDGGAIRREEAEEELIARLRQSVRLRMIADVPLGAFLSGGVDSSAVVAMMAGLRRSRSAPSRSRSGRRDSTNRPMPPRSPSVTAPTTTSGRSIPTPSTCSIGWRRSTTSRSATARRCRPCGFAPMARENVTVALVRRRRRRGLRRLPALSLALLRGARAPDDRRSGCAARCSALLGALYPKLDWAPRPLRAKATLQELARDPADAYFASVSICTDDLRRRLFSPGFAASCRATMPAEVAGEHIGRCGSEDPLSQSPICRFQDLSARRHLDQSRSREHGVTRSKCAFRCSTIPWSNGRRGCRPRLKLRRRRRQVYLQIGARAPCLPEDLISSQAGLCRAARRVVSRAAAAALARDAWTGRCCCSRVCSTWRRSPRCSTSTSPARATTAPRCGRCRCSNRFCGGSTAMPVKARCGRNVSGPSSDAVSLIHCRREPMTDDCARGG